MRRAVQRQSALIARGEIGLICKNGTSALSSTAAGECGLELDFEMDEECAGRVQQEIARVFAFNGAAAESEDKIFSGGQARNGGVFEIAESILALLREDLGNGRCGFGFDDVVHVNESPAETPGNERADGGLTGAHEAGEDDANGRKRGGKGHAIAQALELESFTQYKEAGAESQPKTMMMAPAVMRRPPVIEGTLSFSPRRSQAKTITRGTLSLSSGATRDAGPSCRARK